MAINKEKVLQSAQKFLLKGSIDKAIKEYQKIIEEDPNDVRILLKIGDLYTKAGDTKAATESYLKVADFYSSQGFYLKAVAVYKQILKIDSSLVEVNAKLAEHYHQLGLVGDALGQYQVVAISYERNGQSKEALECLRKMIDLDPENVPCRIKLGELLAKEGLKKEAIREFAMASETLKKQGRIDDYMRVAENLSRLLPDNIQLVQQLANYYVQKGDVKRALSKLQLCFRFNPQDVTTLTLLGDSFVKLNQIDKAASVYRELLRIYQTRNDVANSQLFAKRILELVPCDKECLAILNGGSQEPEMAVPEAETVEEAPDFVLPPPPADFDSIPVEEITVNEPPIRVPTMAPNASPPVAAPVANVAQIIPNKVAVPRQPVMSVVEISVPPVQEDNSEFDKLFGEVQVFLQYGLEAKAFGQLKQVMRRFPRQIKGWKQYRQLAINLGEEFEQNKAEATLRSLGVTSFDLSDENNEAEVESTPVENNEVEVETEIETEIETDIEAEAEVETEIEVEAEEGVGTELEVDIVTEEVADNSIEVTMDESSPEVMVETLPVMPIMPVVPVQTANDSMPLMPLPPIPPVADIPVIPLETPEVTAESSLPLSPILPLAPLSLDNSAPEADPVLTDPDSSFDLGSELDDLFDLGEEAEPEETAQNDLQASMEEVLEEFKRGIANTVSDEDYTTHYDLGQAYMEMGLTDEAVYEFEKAAQFTAKEVEALHMIGLCYMNGERFLEAAAAFKKALNSDYISSSQRLGLRYELASAMEHAGELSEACKLYEKVSLADKSFRDAAKRYETLKNSLASTANTVADATAADDGNTFDPGTLLLEDEEEVASSPANTTGEEVTLPGYSVPDEFIASVPEQPLVAAEPISIPMNVGYDNLSGHDEITDPARVVIDEPHNGDDREITLDVGIDDQGMPMRSTTIPEAGLKVIKRVFVPESLLQAAQAAAVKQNAQNTPVKQVAAPAPAVVAAPSPMDDEKTPPATPVAVDKARTARPAPDREITGVMSVDDILGGLSRKPVSQKPAAPAGKRPDRESALNAILGDLNLGLSMKPRRPLSDKDGNSGNNQ